MEVFAIISGVLLLFYSIFILYLIVGVSRVKSFRNKNNYQVSVIIPFRNEENNLARCITSVLNQTYEKNLIEIILVDDHSTDESKKIAEKYLSNGNIKLLHLDEMKPDMKGKKHAIECGIANSNSEIIVTTDADCWQDEDWLENLISSFDDNTGFVAGPVVFANSKNLFHKFQALEFGSLVAIGAGLIVNRNPLLANGATCAYRRELFHEVGGFNDNANLVSGDEEFLMQKIHSNTKKHVRFCFSENSLTYTEPNNKFLSFINQRMRWVSKVRFYKNSFMLLPLSIIYIFYLSLGLLLIGSFLSQDIFRLFVLVFGVKIILDFIFLTIGLRHLKLQKYLIYQPAAELLHIPYIIIIPLIGLFKNFSWKGRYFRR